MTSTQNDTAPKCAKIGELLSGHVDGELTQQQAQRVPFPGCLWACERLNWDRLIDRWRE